MKDVKKYKTVFARNTNTLPPAMKNVKPHKFKVKPGATPTQVPKPKWGPVTAKMILDWLQWGLDNDLVEKADGSSYSSRLHLAAKYKSSTPKSAPPDGIRITWAGVEAKQRHVNKICVYLHRCMGTIIQSGITQVQILCRWAETILVNSFRRIVQRNNCVLDSKRTISIQTISHGHQKCSDGSPECLYECDTHETRSGIPGKDRQLR